MRSLDSSTARPASPTMVVVGRPLLREHSISTMMLSNPEGVEEYTFCIGALYQYGHKIKRELKNNGLRGAVVLQGSFLFLSTFFIQVLGDILFCLWLFVNDFLNNFFIKDCNFYS